MESSQCGGVRPHSPLGANPFTVVPVAIAPLISFGPERYVSPALSGTVTFDYSNNNGRYVVGAGDMAFETAWSGGSNQTIYAYNGVVSPNRRKFCQSNFSPTPVASTYTRRSAGAVRPVEATAQYDPRGSIENRTAAAAQTRLVKVQRGHQVRLQQGEQRLHRQ